MSKTPDSDKADDAHSTVEQYLVKDPERFALNLARMVEQAGKAAAAWAEPREKGETRDHVAEPMADMVKTFSRLTEYWLSDPQRALEAQTRLYSGYMSVWANAVQRFGANGRPVEDTVKPDRGDKRFQDPEWGRNAFFDFLKQTYLVTSRWAADLVEHAEGLDEHTRHKAGFYVKQVSNAISPSNFILTNPELFRETVASNGENLVRGMKMLAEDIAAGKGDLKLRQADSATFEIGRNLAVTPGKVVGRSDVAEIIQYTPATETVLKRPLLICPPWINKFYILDLNPQKSFIRWAVENGHSPKPLPAESLARKNSFPSLTHQLNISGCVPDTPCPTIKWLYAYDRGLIQAVIVKAVLSKASITTDVVCPSKSSAWPILPGTQTGVPEIACGTPLTLSAAPPP